MKMKKALLCVFALIFVLSAFGCTKSEPKLKVEFPEFEKNIQAAMKAKEKAIYTKDDIYDSLGIAPELYTDGLLYASADGAYLEEVAFFVAKDKESADKIRGLLENRKAQVETEQKNYNPDNYNSAKSSAVVVSGNYVYLVMAREDAVVKAIEANLGK